MRRASPGQQSPARAGGHGRDARCRRTTLAPMRVLVLGGLGFVGRAVCGALGRSGMDVVSASRAQQARGTFNRHVSLDRRDEGQLATALRDLEPDILVDLACYQPAEVEAVVRNFSGARYIFMSTVIKPILVGKTAREGEFTPLEGDVPL